VPSWRPRCMLRAWRDIADRVHLWQVKVIEVAKSIIVCWRMVLHCCAWMLLSHLEITVYAQMYVRKPDSFVISDVTVKMTEGGSAGLTSNCCDWVAEIPHIPRLTSRTESPPTPRLAYPYKFLYMAIILYFLCETFVIIASKHGSSYGNHDRDNRSTWRTNLTVIFGGMLSHISELREGHSSLA